MAFIISTCSISWLNHDAWSETYIGLRKIVYETMPEKGERLAAEDQALCQMSVVSANQLMEIALHNLTRNAVNQKTSYYATLTNEIERITGRNIDLSVEPFLSTEKLRVRRNATVHKSCALANVEMANSALYSAVEGVKELYKHFGVTFAYTEVLEKYPCKPDVWFSTLLMPDE